MSSLSVLEAKLEAESKAFQQLQKELSSAIESRQRLDSQQQENEVVRKEFEHLEDDASVYKLIGPVLVKQEKAEAETNVKNRLELISKEIERVEKQLKDLTTKSEKKKAEIAELQMQYQQQQPSASK
ncbi:prefoldin subunit 6 [Lichtheimia corymbifera JMRC:FSU:9682]|uniref:Prefoldin subunit 6 n=1 Tax=Lichtheimia corymbifera JMRC:FSU:9682 TaxID=1263082 RepID=A0A068RJ59_9FUNG|nr:prefoldin subunit 6 [Lichtheimia corymbifera JMRC:FSU:9682]